MHSAGIAEAFDVSEQIAPGLVPGGVDAVMDALGLEGVEEGLHRGVVPAVPLAAHRGRNPRCRKGLAVGFGGVLDAAVGVMDQTGGQPLALNRHAQRLQCDLGMQGLADGPANDLAGVHVWGRSEVEPTFAGGEVGQVG